MNSNNIICKIFNIDENKLNQADKILETKLSKEEQEYIHYSCRQAGKVGALFGLTIGFALIILIYL